MGSRQMQESVKPRARFNKSFHHFRLLVVLMGGFSFGLVKLLRFNMSVAILRMVNQTELYLRENPNRTVEDFLAEGYDYGGEFSWDNETQNMIMSWYMFAYTLPQVASTKLGIMLGTKLATPISLSICAIATLLTPMSAYWGWQCVIVMRLINGLGGSAILAMVVNLVENWIPLDEISLGLTVMHIVQNLISSAGPLFCGLLAEIHWRFAFYVPGIVALLFCLLWLITIANRPEESWLISQRELNSISARSSNNISAPGGNADAQAGKSHHYQQKRVTESPIATTEATLIDILRQPSFYALFVCWTLQCCTFNAFFFLLPAYLRQFLKIGISEDGLYCSIIQMGLILSSIWPHPLLRSLQTHLKLTRTTSSRVVYAIGCSVVAFTWLYVGTWHRFELLLLFIGRCFQGSTDIVITSSLMNNYAYDNLSAMSFSVMNSAGNFVVPFVSTSIGWYLDYTTRSETGWFYILLVLSLAQLLMFVIFSTMCHSDPIDLKGPTRRTTEDKSTSEVA